MKSLNTEVLSILLVLSMPCSEVSLSWSWDYSRAPPNTPPGWDTHELHPGKIRRVLLCPQPWMNNILGRMSGLPVLKADKSERPPLSGPALTHLISVRQAL